MPKNNKELITRCMQITKKPFGTLPNGRVADLYTLKNSNGMEVRITNFGGIVTHLLVPASDGSKTDVVLGYDKLEGYLDNSAYFGAIIGRYANRIANGRFTIDGIVYQLPVNNGPNTLHGGNTGFDKIIWQAQPISETNSLELTYISSDGEGGFPGTLNVQVIYTLTSDNELKITYSAITDKPTHINLTHHSYFNLDGEGPILNHELMMDADRYVAVNENLIPTGELKSVEESAMDFRCFQRIGQLIDKTDRGYDHTFVLNKSNPAYPDASVVNSSKTLRIDVFTTEPGIQFYSGNFLDGSIRGKNGMIYFKHTGFCLETQHFPDSPNQPEFPSTLLLPDEVYQQTTVYRFYSN